MPGMSRKASSQPQPLLIIHSGRNGEQERAHLAHFCRVECAVGVGVCVLVGVLVMGMGGRV